MWKQAKLYLIVASVALNVAFAATWIAHATTSHAHREENAPQETEHTVWCPLHRELDVSDGQWAQIEPRLREFQAAVEELRQQTDAMRSEVIELIAAEEPDRVAIRKKQNDILETKRRIQDLVAEHLIAEKRDLTLEQQMQLFEMLRDGTSRSDSPPLSGRKRSGIAPVLQNPSENPK